MCRHRAFAAVVIVVCCISATGFGHADVVAPTVMSVNGPIDGVVTEGVAAYEGIPYAAPPVGALRWRPPAPPAPWTALRADDFGASCPQRDGPRFVPPESRAASQSENCLTLNVWAPLARSAHTPVMVWIHGGGNDSGSASDRYYDGASFARDGVVLVSFNYRLGALGFFAPPGGAGDVNFGLLDQLAALRWVRANVAAFGGDPANVTIFGESAGGLDALLLARSQAASGLFVRAIAESAGGIWADMPTLEHARRDGRSFLSALGIAANATLAQLQAIPATKLATGNDDLVPGPTIDGTVVDRPLFASGGVRVPLLIGTNDGDGSLVGDDANPAGLFPRIPAADLASLRARYAAAGVRGDAALTQALFRDGYFAEPARWTAEQTRATQPAYRYRFDYVASFLRFRRGAAEHGSEIPFVFASFRTPDASDDDRRITAAVHDCWIAFARTGVPACAGLPNWTPDAGDGREMIVDGSPSMRDPGDGAVDAILRRDLGPSAAR